MLYNMLRTFREWQPFSKWASHVPISKIVTLLFRKWVAIRFSPFCESDNFENGVVISKMGRPFS